MKPRPIPVLEQVGLVLMIATGIMMCCFLFMVAVVLAVRVAKVLGWLV